MRDSRSLPYSVALGQHIKKLRIKRGFTQKELAIMLLKDESTISLYESGKREPNLRTIVKLARCLSVSIDDLLKFEDWSVDDEKTVNKRRARLKSIFYLKGLTTKEAAERSGITRSYMDAILNGTRDLPVKTAKKIASALQFDWTLFYED